MYWRWWIAAFALFLVMSTAPWWWDAVTPGRRLVPSASRSSEPGPPHPVPETPPPVYEPGSRSAHELPVNLPLPRRDVEGTVVAGASGAPVPEPSGLDPDRFVPAETPERHVGDPAFDPEEGLSRTWAASTPAPRPDDPEGADPVESAPASPWTVPRTEGDPAFDPEDDTSRPTVERRVRARRPDRR
jgi:hypothetical protein